MTTVSLDSRFDMTHLPGSLNLTDPPRLSRSRCGFMDACCNGLTLSVSESTGDQDPESQLELFSRLVRDAPPSCSAVL